MTHTADCQASVWLGELVRLRRLVEDDWRALYAARYDSVDERSFNGGVGNLHTAPDYQQFVARLVETDAYAYAIENEEGEYCGTVRITHLDQGNGVYEMAVQVFTSFRGRGYARDAMRVLMRYAFHELRMNKANSVTVDVNQASRALHASLGFRQEGLRRENVYTDGAYHDEILFGITHAEFDALLD